jgi:hypothetical protein
MMMPLKYYEHSPAGVVVIAKEYNVKLEMLNHPNAGDKLNVQTQAQLDELLRQYNNLGGEQATDGSLAR